MRCMSVVLSPLSHSPKHSMQCIHTCACKQTLKAYPGKIWCRRTCQCKSAGGHRIELQACNIQKKNAIFDGSMCVCVCVIHIHHNCTWICTQACKSFQGLKPRVFLASSTTLAAVPEPPQLSDAFLVKRTMDGYTLIQLSYTLHVISWRFLSWPHKLTRLTRNSRTKEMMRMVRRILANLNLSSALGGQTSSTTTHPTICNKSLAVTRNQGSCEKFQQEIQDDNGTLGSFTIIQMCSKQISF